MACGWSFWAFVVMMHTWTAEAVDPVVVIEATEPATVGGRIEGFESKDITMDCHVENKPADTSVRWQKITPDPNSGKDAVVHITEHLYAYDNHKHGIENPYPFTFRLRIRNAQVADEGRYECFVAVASHGQTKVLDSRVVLVKTKPYFLLGQTTPDVEAKEGSTEVLLCNATGRPPPTIIWSRFGGALLPVGQERLYAPELKIEKIRPEYRGKYRCDASNIIGEETYSITHIVRLDVKFKPILTVRSDEVYQAAGYRTELICYGEANPFPTEDKLYWSKGTTRISKTTGRLEVRQTIGAFNQLTYELIIHRVKAEDYGRYTCNMGNIMEGRTSSISIELLETDEPTPSVKLNRIIAGTSHLVSSLLTVAVCAVLALLQQ